MQVTTPDNLERVIKFQKEYIEALEYAINNMTNKDRAMALFEDGVYVLTHEWVHVVDWYEIEKRRMI